METNQQLNKIFFALADQQRRQIVVLLSEQQHSISQLAQILELKMAHASKLISILEECGLVEKHKQGRQVFCRLNHHTWQQALTFMSLIEPFWHKRMKNLSQFIEDNH